VTEDKNNLLNGWHSGSSRERWGGKQHGAVQMGEKVKRKKEKKKPSEKK